MKELRNKIMDYLLKIPNMNKETMISILNPLKTEYQAKKMLDYLKKNKENRELMRIDNLLKIRRPIAEK